MPLTLQVQRPKDYTVGRTQAYRVVLTLTGPVEYEPAPPNVEDRYRVTHKAFVISRDVNGIQHFERVALPIDFTTLGENPEAELHRASVVDILLQSKSLADEMVAAVALDLQDMLSTQYGRRFRYELAGGDLDPAIGAQP